MRTLPHYIERRLKDYNPNLSLVWDDRNHFWMFMYKGARQFVWKHDDGTTGLNADGHCDEIIKVIQRADTRRLGRSLLDIMDEAEARASYDDQRRDERLNEDLRKSTDPTMDFVRRGCSKPFSHITNNPLAKGA